MGSHGSHMMPLRLKHTITHTQKHVLSHHVGATGRAFSGWHKFGLTLSSNAVAPQSLADILEQHEIQAMCKWHCWYVLLLQISVCYQYPHKSCEQTKQWEKW